METTQDSLDRLRADSQNCARRVCGSHSPRTPIAARSSASSTTVRSSTWSRWRSTSSSRATSWRVTRWPRRTLLDQMRREVQVALDEAARLAERIYPPLLESGGLKAALRAAAAAAGVRARIDVTGAAPRSPEIAGAVYFCWLGLLEHAGARRGRLGRRCGARTASSASRSSLKGPG